MYRLGSKRNSHLAFKVDRNEEKNSPFEEDYEKGNENIRIIKCNLKLALIFNYI